MFNNEFRKNPALYWKKLSWRFNGKSLLIQPDQINMAVLFWYLVKSDAGVRTVHWTRFTRNQEHTTMYNWSHCIHT